MRAKIAVEHLLRIEELVDSIGVPPEGRQAMIAVVTRAFTMGVEATVGEFHAANKAAVKAAAELARELAESLCIKFGLAKPPNTTGA